MALHFRGFRPIYEKYEIIQLKNLALYSIAGLFHGLNFCIGGFTCITAIDSIFKFFAMNPAECLLATLHWKSLCYNFTIDRWMQIM